MILTVNTQLSQPIYEQLRNQIVHGIAARQLLPNEALPSVRRLAADLGINLHTVNKAYAALQGEGYIVMDRRKGAVIAPSVPCDVAFLRTLSKNIMLSAAEARCREMSEEAFIHLCKECYQGVSENGEKESK